MKKFASLILFMISFVYSQTFIMPTPTPVNQIGYEMFHKTTLYFANDSTVYTTANNWMFDNDLENNLKVNLQWLTLYNIDYILDELKYRDKILGKGHYEYYHTPWGMPTKIITEIKWCCADGTIREYKKVFNITLTEFLKWHILNDNYAYIWEDKISTSK